MHPYEKLPMNVVGFILAAWLIGFHLWMLIKKKEAQAFLQAFPRNYLWGAVLMGVGMFWFWLLIIPGVDHTFLGYLAMDLGEFNGAKIYLLALVPAAAYVLITEVKEFLAVRALGLLCLLAAAPMLYSCFQLWPTGKLLLPIYAYAILTAGLFMVSMPYLLRDAIGFACKHEKVWLGGAVGGLLYGIATLICALFFW